MAKYWVGVNWDRVGAVEVEAADAEGAVAKAQEIATAPGCKEQYQELAFIEDGSEWVVDEDRVWLSREVV